MSNDDNQMKKIRNEAYEHFLNLSEPMFGPDLKIDYDNITCFNSDSIKRKVSNFNNIIYCDFTSAKELYEDLFYTYFNNLVKSDSSKYVALNCSLANTGTFIYIPPNTKVDKPLTNLVNGSYERNIIIVDENSELEYTENLDKSYNDEELEQLMSSYLSAFSSVNQTSTALLNKYGKLVQKVEDYGERSSSKALMTAFNYKHQLNVVNRVNFSSVRKYSAVEFEKRGWFVMGAPEYITNDEEILNQVNEYAKSGLRVILLAKVNGVGFFY